MSRYRRNNPGNSTNKLLLIVGVIIILLIIGFLFNGTMNKAYTNANETITNESLAYGPMQVGFFVTGGFGSIIWVLLLIMLGVLAIIGYKVITKYF